MFVSSAYVLPPTVVLVLCGVVDDCLWDVDADDDDDVTDLAASDVPAVTPVPVDVSNEVMVGAAEVNVVVGDVDAEDRAFFGAGQIDAS